MTSDTLIEPLTRRELAILAHLAEDKSNGEIAGLETLALNSVKWYVQRIYAKLGVNKRSEAIERARDLGLLQPVLSVSPVSSTIKNNLPAQMTSFIGRQKEIGDLRQLLLKKETRLLSLTSSGGTGKTRLALQVASSLLDAFPDGVFLVELAPLADPQLVPQSLIEVLGLIEQPGKIPTTLLVDTLRSKQLLLILDSCEHLVDACAELAAILLQAAPRLTILATSREILGVEGEIPYRVPPLKTPDPKNVPSLEEIAQFEAVRLFVVRARVVAPAFELTQDNAGDVIQITRRLDGIPLAIELAAARLRLLSVGQIAQRLDDSFRLLTGGSRTALPRHQTLTALIDWSYDLLTDAERGLLRRLSAFAGGWTLEAAEEVCAGGLLDQADILDLLGQLADKSLILPAPEAGGEMRYDMLETMRQYAHTRLVEAGEAVSVREKHLRYYLRLVEKLEPRLRGLEQIPSLDLLGYELDNLRLALEWSLQADVEAELRLASALMWFWHIRTHWAEGVAWLGQGLEAEQQAQAGQVRSCEVVIVRAKALTALGFHIFMGETPGPSRAVVFLEEALAFYRANGPNQQSGLAWTLLRLGACKFKEGSVVQAQSLGREALSLFQASADPHGMAESLQILGECEIDPAAQKRIYREQLEIDQANEDIEGIATALQHIGNADFVDGNYEDARTALEAGREHYKRVGNPHMIAAATLMLYRASHFSGNLQKAAAYLEQALLDYRERANESREAYCLFWKCMVAIAQGNYGLAAELNEEAGKIAQKAGDQGTTTEVFYLRARLARLGRDFAAARTCAEEGLKAGPDLGYPRMLVLSELGYLALEDGDLERAGRLWREGLHILIRWRSMIWVTFLLDGLAVLAVRQGQLERAARLLGTRHYRAFTNVLSPLERELYTANLERLKATLGKKRLDQLLAEGSGLTFMQMLELAQDEGSG